MRTIVLFFFLLTGLFTRAQQPFTGIIEYKVTDLNNPAGVYKMIMTRTPEKIMVRIIYRLKNKEERVLINTVNDSLYQLDPLTKTYIAEPMNPGPDEDLEMIRTDSVKNILGHKCSGYQMIVDDDVEGFAWVAEDMGGLRKQYPLTISTSITGGKYVMLGFNDSWKNDKRSVVTAVSIKKMDRIPASVFDISGYRSRPKR